jgi:hypothetical protein
MLRAQDRLTNCWARLVPTYSPRASEFAFKHRNSGSEVLVRSLGCVSVLNREHPRKAMARETASEGACLLGPFCERRPLTHVRP